MYSDTVNTVLEEHDIGIGDHIRLTADGETYTGVVMPRSRSGNQDCLVLKLDNGYNIGIDITGNVSLEQSGETPADIQEEINHDLDADHEHSTVEVNPEKPTIAILHTGGTIASKVSYGEGGVTPVTHAEDLVEMYPELTDIANITSVTIRQMFSEDMEFQHYSLLADTVQELHEDVDGIIIGHGTDTMHYTAAALSFHTNTETPIVLVGAQRSSDRPSSDAAMNLVSAAHFITEQTVPGVYICMHQHTDDTTCALHPGTRAKKMHTSRRDAFTTFDTAPAATVSYPDGTMTLNEDALPRTDPEKDTVHGAFENDVALVKLHPGFDPERIDYFRGHDYRGIILEGTGLGHAPINSIDEYTEHHPDLLEKLATFIDDGGVVAMTSQCSHGTVNMNVYDTGRKLKEIGVLPAANLLPETAYIKLAWALGTADTPEDAETLFLENVAGEYVQRREHPGEEVAE